MAVYDLSETSGLHTINNGIIEIQKTTYNSAIVETYYLYQNNLFNF